MEFTSGVAYGLIFLAGVVLAILAYITYRYFKRITDIRDLPRNVRNYSFKGIVTRVGDGDGFRMVHIPLFRSSEITRDIPSLSIRLAGIDAPEMRHFNIPAQPYAKISQKYLQTLVHKKLVHVKVLSIDLYQRIIAIVHVKVGFFRWKNVNVSMVESGLACVYDRSGAEYGGYREVLIAAEQRAKRKSLGIWANKGGILPMDYKKRKRPKV